MMPRQSSRILLILTSLTLLVSIVGNIATGSLPDWVKEWAWSTWLIFLALAGLTVYFTLKHASADTGEKPPPVDENAARRRYANAVRFDCEQMRKDLFNPGSDQPRFARLYLSDAQGGDGKGYRSAHLLPVAARMEGIR